LWGNYWSDERAGPVVSSPMLLASENVRWANFVELRQREVRRITLPHSQVTKGERMRCWENTGRDEGSVPIMGIKLSVGKREVEGE
jgi:hypothetical protein